MNTIQIYPNDLENNIHFNTKYIPRKIDYNEHLLQYHKYWIGDVNALYKLTKIEEYFGVQYYFFEGKSTSQLYTYPIVSDNFYELMVNIDDILDKDIIDNESIHRGYEIKYWFYKNWNKDYLDYRKYLELDSKFLIKDNDSYIVEGIVIKNTYRNCKIVTPRD